MNLPLFISPIGTFFSVGEVIGVCDGILSPRTGMRAGSGINSIVGSGLTQGDALCRGAG